MRPVTATDRSGWSSGRQQRRSAALRAVARDPLAELRNGRLTSAEQAVAIASPFLAIADVADEDVHRGVGDALGLILRHTDREMHRSRQPDEPLQRVVFDLLEQLRVQALAPELAGIRHNLDAASKAWCRHARGNGVAESGAGLLVYTLAHMVRARLRLGMTSEQVDTIIETTRARLGRLTGHTLPQLAAHIDDQAAYADAAAETARLVAEFAEAGDFVDDLAGSARFSMLVPPEWLDVDPDGGGDDGATGVSAVHAEDPSVPLMQLGDYRVFTTAHDVVVTGEDLYPAATLRQARAALDELVAAQAVSSHRIALRLRRLFGTPVPVDWTFGTEDGVVDGRRLSQLIANPMHHRVFRQERDVLRADTAVTLLLDNSGSMKAQRFETLATLADTLSRALDLAAVPHEVLGHTTASWTGGAARQEWKAARSPEDPGRLAEMCTIVYKDFDTSWKRARHSLAAMHVTRHFRESVDGEAIVWAHDRLLARPERRKVLVVVSDGAPAEAATNKANRRGYLSDHLVNVVAAIERRSPVMLGALTVDSDVGAVFARSLRVDLDAPLTLRAYRIFEELFG